MKKHKLIWLLVVFGIIFVTNHVLFAEEAVKNELVIRKDHQVLTKNKVEGIDQVANMFANPLHDAYNYKIAEANIRMMINTSSVHGVLNNHKGYLEKNWQMVKLFKRKAQNLGSMNLDQLQATNHFDTVYGLVAKIENLEYPVHKNFRLQANEKIPASPVSLNSMAMISRNAFELNYVLRVADRL